MKSKLVTASGNGFLDVTNVFFDGRRGTHRVDSSRMVCIKTVRKEPSRTSIGLPFHIRNSVDTHTHPPRHSLNLRWLEAQLRQTLQPFVRTAAPVRNRRHSIRGKRGMFGLNLIHLEGSVGGPSCVPPKKIQKDCT